MELADARHLKCKKNGVIWEDIIRVIINGIMGLMMQMHNHNAGELKEKTV